MKIYIDKHGGMHYHKPNCKITKMRHPYSPGYEEVEHQVRRLGIPYHKEYATIKVEGRYYHHCPICFGYEKRR